MQREDSWVDRRTFLRRTIGAGVAAGVGIIPKAGELIGQNAKVLAGDVPANFSLQQGIDALWKQSVEKKREVVQMYVQYADDKVPRGQWIPVQTGPTSASFIHGTLHDFYSIDRDRPMAYCIDVHTHVGWKASPLSSTDMWTARSLYEQLPYWIQPEKIYKGAKAVSGTHIARWLSDEEVKKLPSHIFGGDSQTEKEHREALLERNSQRSAYRQIMELAYQLVEKSSDAAIRDSLQELMNWHDDVLTIVVGRVRVPLFKNSIQSLLSDTLSGGAQKVRALSILCGVVTHATAIAWLARPESTSSVSRLKYLTEELSIASRHAEVKEFINNKEHNERLRVKRDLPRSVDLGEDYEKSWRTYGAGPRSTRTDEELWKDDTREKQELVAAANRMGFNMQFVPNRDTSKLTERLQRDAPQ